MQKFKILSIFFVLLSMFCNAQQASLFNTYSYDLLQLNVAAVGRTCLEANLNYRSQWVGIKDAPKLYQLNAAMSLGNTNGVGIKVFQQQYGQIKLTNFTGAYAYRAQINKTSKLHLGIGASYNQNRFDITKISVVDNDDPSLARASQQSSNNFDCEAGALFLNEKITAGISAAHIYNTNKDFQSVSLKLKPEICFVGAYKVFQGKSLSVEPWLVNRYTVSGSNKLEGMVNVKFLQVFTIGAGYRLNYGMMALAGVEFGKLKIAYSFDYANGKNLGSANQILLGIDLCKKKKQNLPDTSVIAQPKVTEPPITPSVAPVEEKKTSEPVTPENPKSPEVIAPLETKTDAVTSPTNANVNVQVNETPKVEIKNAEEFAIEGIINTDNNNINWQNKTVKLLNEKGEVIETTKTNNFGAFVFKHIDADKNYVVSIDENDPSLKPGTKIKLSNLDGKEIKTWVKGEEKFEFKILKGDKSIIKDLQADDESLEMKVNGMLLDEKNQPIKFAHLIVKESDGSNPVKITTDNNGHFIFKTLSAEKSYIFETDETDKAYAAVKQIQIANRQGKVFKTIDMMDDKFTFNLLEAEKNQLSEYSVEDIFIESILRKTKKQIQKPATESIKQDFEQKNQTVGMGAIATEANVIAEYIIFEKKSSILSDENVERLKQIAKIINSKTGNVTIVGFASKDGKPDINIALAEARAQIVRGTLISLGVKASRLSLKNGCSTEFVNKYFDVNQTVRFED